MNKKETLIWSIIDNVIIACDIPRADDTHSISREDVVGKFREENVVMARALVVEQMVYTCVVKEFKSIGMIVGNINNYYSL